MSKSDLSPLVHNPHESWHFLKPLDEPIGSTLARKSHSITSSIRIMVGTYMSRSAHPSLRCVEHPQLISTIGVFHLKGSQNLQCYVEKLKPELLKNIINKTNSQANSLKNTQLIITIQFNRS